MERWDELDERIAIAHATLRAEKHLVAVSRSEVEKRSWQNHDLASLAEYRLGIDVDPLLVAESERGLLIRKATDVGRLEEIYGGYWIPYWIQVNEQAVGTVALATTSCSTTLSISSLHIRRPYRRSGHAHRLLTVLNDAAQRAGLSGIELGTSWCWQSAVRLYVRAAMWVRMWKRDLSLVLRKDLPRWSVYEKDEEAHFCLHVEEGRPPLTLITARRDGARLDWSEHRVSVASDSEIPWIAPGTFALALSLRGWPLITGDDAWERQCQSGFSDGGGPEGLAFKIVRWEAWARHHGWRVDTPRIPGLDYPSWRELYPDED